MEKPIINYETLIRITKAISMIRDPEEIVLITVEGVRNALKVKGCALFLFSMKSDELQLAASYGLSNEYLDKGSLVRVEGVLTGDAAEGVENQRIWESDEGPRASWEIRANNVLFLGSGGYQEEPQEKPQEEEEYEPFEEDEIPF